MTTELAIRAQFLTKRYGATIAVGGIDLAIPRGLPETVGATRISG